MTVVINGTTGITAPGTETFGDGTAIGGATNPIVSMAKGANNYVQGYIVNNTDGVNASADLVAYPSNGTDSSGWIDMGITGPTFSQAAFSVTGPNEAYLFGSAPSGASKTGNLVIATDSTGTANAIQFYTGGFNQAKSATRMVIDGSGNVGIGTSSPNKNLETVGTIRVSRSGNAGTYMEMFGGSGVVDPYINVPSGFGVPFQVGGSEKARIDSSGNLLVGTTTSAAKITSNTGASNAALATRYSGANGASGGLYSVYDNTTGTAYGVVFFYNGFASQAGQITYSSTTVTYGTSSDYRLKENVQPMTGALDKVAALKPVTYTWKSTGESSQGFIAHELQEIIPECVTGEKDAVKEDGSPEYQGIDTSFLVATLTAAIQEQQAIIEQLRADVEVLKAK